MIHTGPGDDNGSLDAYLQTFEADAKEDLKPDTPIPEIMIRNALDDYRIGDVARSVKSLSMVAYYARVGLGQLGALRAPTVFEGLTARQLEVLAYIRGYLTEHKRPPSLRDIGHHFGIKSHGNVHRVVKRLATLGYITMKPGVSRSINVTRKGMGK